MSVTIEMIAKDKNEILNMIRENSRKQLEIADQIKIHEAELIQLRKQVYALYERHGVITNQLENLKKNKFTKDNPGKQ